MTAPQPPSKLLNIALWIAQILVALTLAWAGYVKLLQPVENVAAMWPWAGQVSEGLLRFTGAVDVLGAIGLIIPALTRIRPNFTPVAAIGTVLLMISAIVFHISRGEESQIGFNIVFAFIAAFIAWGRLKKAPIFPK